MSTSTSVFKPEFSAARFRDLVLHVAKECEADPTFGATKLNNILFYVDFYAYRRTGKPITGATYQKLPEGPAPREMLRQRATLVEDGVARLVARPYFNGVQHRLVVTAGNEIDPDKAFSDEEREIIGEVIKFFEGKTAREASDFSHTHRGWMLAEYGEDIPYGTAWLSDDYLDQDERAFGLELAKKHDR